MSENKNRFLYLLCAVSIWFGVNAQITNAENLEPFVTKLKRNEAVTQILFIGDSHIQADWLTGYLRNKFQEEYGNAGRGLVFPYAVANSNGPEDISAYSNTTWENFRLVYEQDVFPKIGASGFVIGNKEPSILEINLRPEDAFTKVVIFNDSIMKGEPFELMKSNESLKGFIKKDKKIFPYIVKVEDTFPEIASKFYTTTTRLNQLNQSKKPIANQPYSVEQVGISYDFSFENQLKSLPRSTFCELNTVVNLSEPNTRLLLKTNAKNGNVFYGFQFLNSNTKGVVFNTVGVNGATYADFLKYPLQLQQLKLIQPDIAIIALGTNESLGAIGEEEFKRNAMLLISELRKGTQLPILLISPPDNKLKGDKAELITKWIAQVATQEKVAFYDLNKALGGRGYFQKALNNKDANKDGVHFLKTGYEKQAQKIYEALKALF
ncbi:peptidoglycan-binding protein [Riemerella anatipestifer]|uniref:GDSL-type esterase/lipase family protein n=1 Tax=Riemerella anatipestifer TaxID=34085 RepID=UPI00129DD8A4|nr:GDSL-type esterase/lipase family protein [Riemerella anatipestifer]MBT0550963.1 peptidoglycan-binding protein [Riemerella anatipestifer]MBT0553116.1 peptidoglycan-binding protein [Riemerella anatipestifer]MCE3023808.1 GDSL-type esterase/lipase family protein [Riemerella anatipestifer]MCU7559541.1 GDSL-type esterase/lipase family protein [Riemerella anatipestifer]MDY3448739.1 GDSL-type esterase/lipase family protein [Riemerella anatipestifer]